MDLGITHFLPNLHQEDLQLLQTPAQSASKKRETESMNTLGDVFMAPQPYFSSAGTLTSTLFTWLTHFLHRGILRPFICRPFINHLYYVLKAGSYHLLFVQIRTIY